MVGRSVLNINGPLVIARTAPVASQQTTHQLRPELTLGLMLHGIRSRIRWFHRESLRKWGGEIQQSRNGRPQPTTAAVSALETKQTQQRMSARFTARSAFDEDAGIEQQQLTREPTQLVRIMPGHLGPRPVTVVGNRTTAKFRRGRDEIV